ncbi:MAG: 50S ribosomal protein L2 [Candidatus Syntrophoarchaeum sp.]|nr:50S ribosomal protein L2 [Candidatus Syntrophoarchaeum sp.]
MGKRIISQRRGRGRPTYSAPSHKYRAKLDHVKVEGKNAVEGIIIEIVHDPARSAPVGLVKLENGEKKYFIIPEGLCVGDAIAWGPGASVKPGNTLPLKDVPEGSMVCNIESKPGDGGKFVRSSGTAATVVSHEMDKRRTMVQLPSGSLKWLPFRCMATIGVVAGGGRLDKPFVKAGKKYHKMKSRATKYPRTSAVAMNPVDHPFGGGGQQHTGKPKTVARGTPPGRKVGSIAARRTGKR